MIPSKSRKRKSTECSTQRMMVICRPGHIQLAPYCAHTLTLTLERSTIWLCNFWRAGGGLPVYLVMCPSIISLAPSPFRKFSATTKHYFYCPWLVCAEDCNFPFPLCEEPHRLLPDAKLEHNDSHARARPQWIAVLAFVYTR